MRTAARMLILTIVALTIAGAARAADAPLKLKVMTFNIRTMSIPDGLNNWYIRRAHVADVIERQRPDLFGLQEAFTAQAEYIARRLPDYEWFGPARDDGKNLGERCPVFYRRDRFDLVASGTFWYAETPDQPSKSWDAAFPRIVTWGRFKDRATGREFIYMNTHFDHMGDRARLESARIIVEKAKAVGQGLPVIANGDFNITDQFPAYQVIAAEWKDARLLAASPQGPEGTTREFKTDSMPKNRIDFVFLSPGIKVDSYRVLDDTYGNKRRPSDHMPVVVELTIGE